MKLPRVITLICLILAHGRLASAQIPCSYTVSHIIQGPWCGQFWGYPATTGTAISPNGRYVVGFWELCGSGFYRAFVFDTQSSQFTTLPFPSASWVQMRALDVSNAGIIVGHGDDTNTSQRGWIYDLSSGQYTIVEPQPGGVWSSVNAVNSSGTVCGFQSLGPGPDVTPWAAFVWTPQDGGSPTSLGVINGPNSVAEDISDDGTVVGCTGGNSMFDVRAFAYSRGNIAVLPPIMPGGTSEPFGTNGTLVVGYGRTESNVFVKHAFVYDLTTGTMITISPPADYRDSYCSSVTDSGLVIGHYAHPTGGGVGSFRSFLWKDGVLADLDSKLPEGQLYFLLATGLNDSHQITGQATSAEGHVVAFVISPAEYPSIADIDQNCRVDIGDLLILVTNWGAVESPADVNHDRIVNIDDLLILINDWTSDAEGERS
jgi:uncharacterized membrane protein